MNRSEVWYIIKRTDGHCDIVASNQSTGISDDEDTSATEASKNWGPFASEEEAIARRIGLIRAGKCQPV